MLMEKKTDSHLMLLMQFDLLKNMLAYKVHKL